MVQKTFCDFCEKEMKNRRKINIKSLTKLDLEIYNHSYGEGGVTVESWDICDACTRSFIYSPISQMTGISSPIPLPEKIIFTYKKWKE